MVGEGIECNMKILLGLLTAFAVFLVTISFDVRSSETADPNIEYKSITITLGGSPNFLYLIPYEDQIRNFLSGVLLNKNTTVNVEYHPWNTAPKFLQLPGYATVANIPEGFDLPSTYISSYRFSVANGKDISLIMANNEKNKAFMKKFNRALIDNTVKPR